MKLKILAIGIMLMMLCSTLLATAELNDNDNIEKTTTDDIKEIRVAIYSMGDLYGSDIQFYFDMLDGYQWKVGSKIYRFTATKIDDEGIFKGDLNTKNYDVFTIPYAEGQQLCMVLSSSSIKNIIWKIWKLFALDIKNIIKTIKINYLITRARGKKSGEK